jgi:hypothetical protein
LFLKCVHIIPYFVTCSVIFSCIHIYIQGFTVLFFSTVQFPSALPDNLPSVCLVRPAHVQMYRCDGKAILSPVTCQSQNEVKVSVLMA